MPQKILRDKISREKLAIVYKLLNDVLFISLIFFFLALITEGLIPGFVSSRFGLYKLALLVLALIMLIHSIGRFIQAPPQKKPTKKTTGFLLLAAALLVFNSLFRLDLFLNLAVLFLVLLAGYLLYREIFKNGFN